ncbi:hypothetical protein BDW02DRAFT_492868, partial [Decorospora gaudefroyi]
AILTPRLLLVPYCEHHVLTYHEWMRDVDLQRLTASNPLSLPQEYEMQKKWRTECDKLSFVICLRGDMGDVVVVPGVHDGPECMIGDVNLFLGAADTDAEEEGKGGDLAGELEIMLAHPKHRNKGYAKEALLAFLWYVTARSSSASGGLLSEYEGVHGCGPYVLRYFCVRIHWENGASLRVFAGLGFGRVGGGEGNFFGEVEMRRGVWDGDGDGDLEGEVGRIVGYGEV